MKPLPLDSSYLKRFKVSKQYADIGTPYWDNLKGGFCPFCGNRLKTTLDQEITYCKSKKHSRPFVIQSEKLCKLLK